MDPMLLRRRGAAPFASVPVVCLSCLSSTSSCVLSRQASAPHALSAPLRARRWHAYTPQLTHHSSKCFSSSRACSAEIFAGGFVLVGFAFADGVAATAVPPAATAAPVPPPPPPPPPPPAPVAPPPPPAAAPLFGAAAAAAFFVLVVCGAVCLVDGWGAGAGWFATLCFPDEGCGGGGLVPSFGAPRFRLIDPSSFASKSLPSLAAACRVTRAHAQAVSEGNHRGRGLIGRGGRGRPAYLLVLLGGL